MKKNKPNDLNKVAASIMAESTGEREKGEAPTKNESATETERLGGLKGGKARAKKLTALQQRKIAIKAAHAKWKKNNPK
jgi:hypothetical protein